jgi:MoaA/NifB/PqqE/SkfB family radical SAM enzyme
MLAGTQWALKQEVMRAWPVLAKVDISPLCNLRCTVCVHATPSPGSSPLLSEQRFRATQRMSVDRYRDVVRQLAGHTAGVSLYYLGDPLTHPHLDEICAATRDAGLNAHVSTNFSFELSDERLRSLLTSGITHLTVCVDGLTQEVYQRTRVGGQIARVLDNLERLLSLRSAIRGAVPRVEVQYVKFQHNVAQLEEARLRLVRMGVDQFTNFWGSLHNYTDKRQGRAGVGKAHRPRVVPRCTWPYFALLVRYDGDVIPCCTHREGEQYANGVDTRAVGNVFEAGVWEVWNSPAYRALRRLSANPGLAAHEPALQGTFCEGCPVLFENDEGRYFISAETRAWEEIYESNLRGRVTRRPMVQIESRRSAPGSS